VARRSAAHALSPRRDKRAIAKVAPLGFRSPCPITSHEASFDTNDARRSTRLPLDTLKLRRSL
jgi:hypothetical protein